MKNIFILRHAQAKSHSFLVNDKERKLTDLGKLELEVVATKFKLFLQFPIDLIISSNAVRTKMTTEIFSNVIEADKIIYNSDLYNAPFQTFYEIITTLPNEIKSIIIVAHNPGVTHFVNSLNLVKIDNLPTSGLFGASVFTKHWTHFEDSEKRFLYFDCPNYKN